MKKFLFIAAAALAMVSCSKDSEVIPSVENGKQNAIGFQVTKQNMGRAANDMQNTHYNFGVFAHKNTTGETKVMENYLVGYMGTNVGYKMDVNDQTTLGTSKWSYEKLGKNEYQYDGSEGYYKKGQTFFMSNWDVQFLRYWDHTSSWTNFYAYAPYINGTSTVTFDNPTHTMTFADGTIKDGYDDTFMYEYLYATKNVPEGVYNQVVNMTFKHLNSKIRLTFWEDIAGYSVEMKDLVSGSNVGISAAPAKADTPDYKYGNLAKNAGAKITFTDNTTSGVYVDSPVLSSSNFLNPTYYTGVKKDEPNFNDNEYLNFKIPTAAALATSKLEATNKTTGIENFSPTVYFGIPKDDNCGLTFHVSFELTAEQTGEKILVQDARVYVPGTQCAWQAGKEYTYVFKITKNTTGTTGNPGHIVPGDPNPGTQALYPIIFDGLTIEDWGTAVETEHPIN